MEINEKFWFKANKNRSIKSTHKALESYRKNFGSIKSLDGDVPIFLDTNILLQYYGMSSVDREKLISFIENYKDRLVITKQIEEEYLRNRVGVISDFFGGLNRLWSDYEKDLMKGIPNKFKSFLENKILKHDFSEIWNEINSIKATIEKQLSENATLSQGMKEKIDNIRGENSL